MRQQYHSRTSAAGRLVWDVNRLVRLARTLEVRDVRLQEIAEIDEPYWSGEEDRPPTCRQILEHARLIQSADLSYPILLCADGRVMDGMHRVLKALDMGRATIQARRFAQTPPPDYVDVNLDDLPYDAPPDASDPGG